MHAAGFAELPQVPLVQLRNNLFDRRRYGSSTALSVACNTVGAFIRNHSYTSRTLPRRGSAWLSQQKLFRMIPAIQYLAKLRMWTIDYILNWGVSGNFD